MTFTAQDNWVRLADFLDRIWFYANEVDALECVCGKNVIMDYESHEGKCVSCGSKYRLVKRTDLICAVPIFSLEVCSTLVADRINGQYYINGCRVDVGETGG